jgi:hypothetical protein
MNREALYDQFTRDMEEAGFEVRESQGRFGYYGPFVAVIPAERDNVIRATDVPLQEEPWLDELVIFPRAAP